MSFAPFDVRPIAARIKASVAELRQVGVAADYAAVKNLGDFPAPCAYVLLAQEQYQENPPGHGKRGQQVQTPQVGRVSFGVVVAGRNYREQSGGQLAGEINLMLQKVRSCLHGWVPDVAGARPLQLQQGDLLQYDHATSLWCDVWRTQIILTPEAP